VVAAVSFDELIESGLLFLDLFLEIFIIFDIIGGINVETLGHGFGRDHLLEYDLADDNLLGFFVRVNLVFNAGHQSCIG
jgi:hypothetical protein